MRHRSMPCNFPLAPMATLNMESNRTRMQTANGYVDIGPQNSGYCHFQTDRATFYFDHGLCHSWQHR